MDTENELKKNIEMFIKKINTPIFLPPKCYRRNSIYYTLLCYVNNITAIYISDNYEAIPIFINRARKELPRFKIDNNEFYSLIEEYLNCMNEFLIKYSGIKNEKLELFEIKKEE